MPRKSKILWNKGNVCLCASSGHGSEEAIKDTGLLFKAEYPSKNGRARTERLEVL